MTMPADLDEMVAHLRDVIQAFTKDPTTAAIDSFGIQRFL